MDALSSLADGFAVALSFQNICLAVFGCFLGTIIGAIPGLGPTNGIAILIPLAFSLRLGPAPAMILLTSVYYGAMYGGRIASILLNIPGDAAAVMTTLDGYPMARRGQAGEALAISGFASFFGSFAATWGLVFLAPVLVKVALLFGPAEYFALYILAFATLGGVTSHNQGKALFAAALGLGIAMVGVDPQTGFPRFTFGMVELYDGVSFLVSIVGLFAISEVLMFLEHRDGKLTDDDRPKLGRVFAPLSMFKQTAGAMLRSTGLGFLAGVLPGAGASLGAFIAYTTEKRLANRDDTFGKGDPRGVVAPEAANNAAAGGALVPMLALGIPGSAVTAVLLAMLLALNITPGPLLFQKQPDVVWGLIAALFIGNFVLLVMNIPFVGMFVRILLIPSRFLMPGVAMVSFVGVYSISGSTSELLVTIVFGVIGYVLRKLDIPLVPVILGILLGNEMEKSLRRALTISDGDWNVLFGSPLAIGLWVFAAVGLLAPIMVNRYSRRTTGQGGSKPA